MEDWKARVSSAQSSEQLVAVAEELVELGDPEAARRIALGVIADDPSNAEAHNILGCIAWSIGSFDGAEHHFMQARSSEPGNTDIGKNLIELYRLLDRTEDALSVCTDLLHLHPDDDELRSIAAELRESLPVDEPMSRDCVRPDASQRRAAEFETVRRVVARAGGSMANLPPLTPLPRREGGMLGMDSGVGRRDAGQREPAARHRLPSIAGGPRGVHFGSYWMGENDVVRLMALDLEELCPMRTVDTRIYDHEPSDWFEADYRFHDRNPVKWLDHERVMSEVIDHRANFVVANSGGMSLRPETIELLRREGVTCIGISLSDPDVFPYHGRIYAHLYDLYYTNSLYSIDHQYGDDVNTRLLPFAASTRLHRPLPDVSREHDLVIVGHAQPTRIPIVEALRSRCSVGLFGEGWGTSIRPVNGLDHVRAINCGKAYLSFARTAAGFTNVKVGIFEAAACRTCLVTDHFPEMERYFRYGLEVVGYAGIDELLRAVDHYLSNDQQREWVTENSYRRFLDEHTWTRRWESVLEDVRSAV